MFKLYLIDIFGYISFFFIFFIYTFSLIYIKMKSNHNDNH